MLAFLRPKIRALAPPNGGAAAQEPVPSSEDMRQAREAHRAATLELRAVASEFCAVQSSIILPQACSTVLEEAARTIEQLAPDGSCQELVHQLRSLIIQTT